MFGIFQKCHASTLKVDIWQQKNESMRCQQKANYANSSWSTATWQPVTCSCPWTRSVKSRILASLETSTLMRHTGKKPRENVSKILFIKGVKTKVNQSINEKKRRTNSCKTFASASKMDGARVPERPSLHL